MNQNLIDYDAIIIGAGATGLSAAVTLAEGGASVLVFEKQSDVGGTSINFRGTFAVESMMQRRKFIAYSRDQAWRKIMEFSHWLANPLLVREIVNQSAETIDWLKERGVIFTEVVTNIPHAPQTYHLIKDSGADVVKALHKKALERDVTFRLSCPVTSIFKNENRTYTVGASESEGECRYTSKAIIIASGGYANNPEWIKKYSGLDLDVNIHPIGNEGKMGDGIRMAFELGAAERGIRVLEMLRTGMDIPDPKKPPPPPDIGSTVIQPFLWVDVNGERFCDECVTFDDTSMGNASVRLKNGRSFTIFDTATVRYLMEKGIDKALVLDFPPGQKLRDLDKQLEKESRKIPQDIFIANNIRELAKAIGVNPENLENTVKRYNASAEKGYDELFNKDPKYLRPVLESPFYAAKAQTVFLGTMGGIKINHHTEVIDTEYNVIPGLFAGGFDAGGMYGDSYSMRDSTGLASCFALNSGRLAGKSALKFIRA